MSSPGAPYRKAETLLFFFYLDRDGRVGPPPTPFCVVPLMEVLYRLTLFDCTSTRVDVRLHKVDFTVSRPVARGGRFQQFLWVRGGVISTLYP